MKCKNCKYNQEELSKTGLCDICQKNSDNINTHNETMLWEFKIRILCNAKTKKEAKKVLSRVIDNPYSKLDLSDNFCEIKRFVKDE